MRHILASALSVWLDPLANGAERLRRLARNPSSGLKRVWSLHTGSSCCSGELGQRFCMSKHVPKTPRRELRTERQRVPRKRAGPNLVIHASWGESSNG